MSSKKPDLPQGLHLDTLAVRAAVDKTQYGENSEALFITSSFTQPDCETAARRFSGEEEGYIYSRFTNPTVASMEKRLAALEGRSEEHTSELQSQQPISYAVFCLKKFFFNDTATTEIYTLSLHDALPISRLFLGRRDAGFVSCLRRVSHVPGLRV